ncbi:type II toxin-antitoxin system VapC family toxin [Sphingomonas sp.]|uniref:type II toxin-antitoxin system VapC family toxin n=1 Tax=Sphingomonas sp. TaxID=28214 RepID=UPI0035BC8B64
MIVADTSAFAAIILGEDDARRFADAIDREERVLVAAPTAFELQLVVVRKLGPDSLIHANRLLEDRRIEIVPWELEHVAIATDALIRFRGRPARLNFGDCMTYALAKSLGAPLLYKGNDFAATDIRSALDG